MTRDIEIDCHGTKEQGISKSKESRGIFLEEMMLTLKSLKNELELAKKRRAGEGKEFSRQKKEPWKSQEPRKRHTVLEGGGQVQKRFCEKCSQ